MIVSYYSDYTGRHVLNESDICHIAEKSFRTLEEAKCFIDECSFPLSGIGDLIEEDPCQLEICFSGCDHKCKVCTCSCLT